jgi:hypothetical protein
MIDFNSLTLDEVEQIELMTGRNIESIIDDGAPKGRALKVLIFTMKKRTDPSFTIEDAGKLSLVEATDLFNGASNPKD